MLVVPLKRGGEPIGVLSILDRRDGGFYGPEDMERAALFAELAVTALDVAAGRLHEPRRDAYPLAGAFAR